MLKKIACFLLNFILNNYLKKIDSAIFSSFDELYLNILVFDKNSILYKIYSEKGIINKNSEYYILYGESGKKKIIECDFTYLTNFIENNEKENFIFFVNSSKFYLIYSIQDIIDKEIVFIYCLSYIGLILNNIEPIINNCFAKLIFLIKLFRLSNFENEYLTIERENNKINFSFNYYNDILINRTYYNGNYNDDKNKESDIFNEILI